MREMDGEELWVFGYGSLIWQPGFDFAERVTARLTGWHRSFFMRSVHYRGTEAAPGLVLALDAGDGAVCNGIGYRVAPARAAQVLDYLRERELVASAYVERFLPLTLADGREVEAVTYVIDPAQPLYCGHLTLEQQAQIIARACGNRGPNCEYLFNTNEHLHELGLADQDMDWLARRVRDVMVADAPR